MKWENIVNTNQFVKDAVFCIIFDKIQINVTNETVFFMNKTQNGLNLKDCIKCNTGFY